MSFTSLDRARLDRIENAIFRLLKKEKLLFICANCNEVARNLEADDYIRINGQCVECDPPEELL